MTTDVVYAQAQQKKPVPMAKPKEELIPLEDAVVVHTKVAILIAGGYFIPGTTESTMLNNSWSVKLMLQQNNIQKTAFGLGADISYAKLSDKEYNGSITYMTALPVVTLTLPLYKALHFQAKAGPGFSVLLAKINNSGDSSLSMTLGGGSGIFFVIKNSFIIGCEGMYHYYFQIHSSSSKSVHGYIGYLY